MRFIQASIRMPEWGRILRQDQTHPDSLSEDIEPATRIAVSIFYTFFSGKTISWLRRVANFFGVEQSTLFSFLLVCYTNRNGHPGRGVPTIETDTPGGVSLREKRTPREGCPYRGNGHPGRGVPTRKTDTPGGVSLRGGILWNYPKETTTASGDLITAKMVLISSPSAPKTGREFCQGS